jgi:hypothetical protein
MNIHPTYGWDILDVVLDFVLKSARRGGHCGGGEFQSDKTKTKGIFKKKKKFKNSFLNKWIIKYYLNL